MSHGYIPVQWNKNKKIYDITLWLGILLYIAVFMLVSSTLHTGDEALSPMTLLIRALGSLGFLLITLILCIGPLARLSTRFLPLLYNRRHLGVSMFLIVLVHGVLVLMWYHGFGAINPIASVFTSPGSFANASDIRFQPFGFVALVILFFMAATSHDYWNTNLGAPVWKALHMSVYPAYGLIVAHVAYGAMQDSTVGLLPLLVFISALLVGSLHIVAALRYSRGDQRASKKDWVVIEDWQTINNNRGVVVELGKEERVAVFRYDNNKLAAVSNVCEHQNGPLGEGCVVDGLITCPWHGFQYQLEDGRAPAPFTERLATYQLKMDGDLVLLNRKALPPGTPRPVLEIQQLISTEGMANA